MSQVGQLMTGKMERTTVVLTEQMILEFWELKTKTSSQIKVNFKEIYFILKINKKKEKSRILS